jgi:hypothetical protein
MLKIFNENYYLDIEKIEEFIHVNPPEGFTGISENHISVVKYDMIKIMVDVLMSENDDNDETLGLQSNNTSIPFRLAFNTMLNKKLINKY